MSRGSRQERMTRALAEHLARGGEAALLSAYEIGREALDEGQGVLDVATLVHQAMARAAPPESRDLVSAAQDLALECLSPFEMAHRQAREANTALRGLNDLLEEQTRRISHELHDQAGQLVASVYLAVSEVARDAPAPIAERLRAVHALLDRVEEQLRRLSHELRPTMLDDLGLVAALEFLAEGVAARHGLAIAVDGPRDERLGGAVETVLYRVVQEALTNVARHARARRIDVRITQEGASLCCAVRDDGVGFDVQAVMERGGAGGIGLLGIRERLARVGGTLRIASSPGQGTELRALVPVVGRAERRARQSAASGRVSSGGSLGESPD